MLALAHASGVALEYLRAGRDKASVQSATAAMWQRADVKLVTGVQLFEAGS